jgi:hypothetical protein
MRQALAWSDHGILLGGSSHQTIRGEIRSPYRGGLSSRTGRTGGLPVESFSGSGSAAKMEPDSDKSIRMRGNTRFNLLVPLVFLGLFLACRCVPTWQPTQYQNEAAKIAVRFDYVDKQATSVCVSGSFNSWSQQSDCMIRFGDAWSFRVSLPPGRYQYVFVIDGSIWREDPGAVLAEDDGFGMKNSVLIVE